MLVKGNQIASAVSMTLQLLISKARRVQSGAMRWNSSDTWRLIIVLLYGLLMMIEWRASRL